MTSAVPVKPFESGSPNFILDAYSVGLLPNRNDDIYLGIFPATSSFSVYDSIVPEDSKPNPITPEIASKFVPFVMMKN